MSFLYAIYYNNRLLDYLIAVGIILLSIVAGKLLYWIITNIIKVFTKKTKTNLDDIIVEALDSPAVFFVFYIGFNYAYRTLTLSEGTSQVFQNISFILLAINISWIVINLVDGFIKEYFIKLAEKTESELDDQILPVIRTIVKVVIILIALIAILDNMGFDIASLLAGLGIGGLAFALAAQDTLKNFFGGVAVFADKPFKVGDRIKLDDTRDGFVREIGVRSTRIETFDGTYIIVPNAKIADNILENVSREKTRRIKFNLDIEYDTSEAKIEKGIKLIKDIIKKNKKTSGESIVTFDDFGDYSLKIQVIYWITEIDNVLDIKHEINMDIKKQFEKEKIQFAYPSRTIYMRK